MFQGPRPEQASALWSNGLVVQKGTKSPGNQWRSPATRPAGLTYSRCGPINSAKLCRARFSRLFTVPRLQCMISAISS